MTNRTATRHIVRHGALLVSLAALVLAACGGSSSSGGTATSTVIPTTIVAAGAPVGVATTVAGVAPPVTAGDPDAYAYGAFKRVNFASGTNNATLADPLEPGKVNGYVLGASAGQSMFVNVSSTERFAVAFDVYGPDDKLLATTTPTDPNLAEVYATTGGSFNVDLVLPADGDYLVVVSGDPGLIATMYVEIAGTTSTPAPAPPTPAAAACSTYTANDTPPLKLCDKGDAVLVVQQALTVAGYPVTEDGFFGPATEAAVRGYQTEYAIPVTGAVDGNMFQLMTGD
jgi:hypothetical protein